MGSIYKNASRLGEGLARSQEVWDLMTLLGDQVDKFKVNVNEKNQEECGSTAVCPGLMLEKLSKHPAFDEIVDTFFSRTSFMRLWTIHDTCLAPGAKLTIFCGRVEIPWKTFSGISSILFRCFRLWKFKDEEKTPRNVILTNIILRRQIQEEAPLLQEDFFDMLLASTFVHASDKRDCVFGALGLFGEDTRVPFSNLGYRNEPEEIFRAATEAIVNIGHKSLEYLTYNHTVRGDDSKLMLPSWVWMLGFWRHQDHLKGNKLTELKDFYTPHKTLISGDNLLAWGPIFNTVKIAYPSFSSENFEKTLLNIHFTVRADTKAAETNDAEIKFGRLKKVLFRLVFGMLTGAFDPVEQYEG
ncbi:hypothetical protein BHYA_0323g00090 [Botrytis hyacinthi]|uniref:Heterokaryon incompatibility domain-containing protein n=1 Tax=Botrytis hyacinthi TaxID=278943 RepID=A0A4Z1GAG2_9HELO|nr:hypothetical protein BHYA_0323g00090 [Botrytis hyacinthi]